MWVAGEVEVLSAHWDLSEAVVGPPQRMKACASRSTHQVPFQLLIAQLKRLLGLIPEPIRLAHIKTRLLSHCYSGVKVCGILELLQKPRILFELGKEGCELFF